MKYRTLFLVTIAAFGLISYAADYTVNTEAISYSPNDLTVEVGDEITIQASGMHPLVQVSQATWDANGATALAEGWGTKTTSYTFTADAEGVIYYVCANHVSSGMKGKITVNAKTSAELIENNNSLTVYSIPGGLQVNFVKELELNSVVKLYNVTGQLAHSFLLKNQNNAINSSLTRGVYIYQLIKDNNRLQSGKIIVP